VRPPDHRQVLVFKVFLKVEKLGKVPQGTLISGGNSIKKLWRKGGLP
jgi:hypothetical protein